MRDEKAGWRVVDWLTKKLKGTPPVDVERRGILRYKTKLTVKLLDGEVIQQDKEYSIPAPASPSFFLFPGAPKMDEPTWTTDDRRIINTQAIREFSWDIVDLTQRTDEKHDEAARTNP